MSEKYKHINPIDNQFSQQIDEHVTRGGWFYVVLGMALSFVLLYIFMHFAEETQLEDNTRQSHPLTQSQQIESLEIQQAELSESLQALEDQVRALEQELNHQ